MPLVIPCPSCKARLKAPENLIGKSVKCPNCQTTIAVKAPAGESPAPARQPAASKPPRKTAPEPVEDFEELDERPSRKPAPRKARDDDEDFVEAPPKKAKGKGKPAPEDDFEDVDDRRDDDFDDEDAPPRKKGKGIPTARVTENDKTQAFNLYLYTLLLQFVPGCGGLLALGYFFYQWTGKRKESPLVDWHGKQILNSVITAILLSLVLMVIYGVGIAGVAVIQDAWPMLVAAGLAGLIAIGWSLTNLVIYIIGMMRAKAGVYYRFPHVLHLLK
jgi:uncharacterized Tic20 family protein